VVLVVWMRIRSEIFLTSHSGNLVDPLRRIMFRALTLWMRLSVFGQSKREKVSSKMVGPEQVLPDDPLCVTNARNVWQLKEGELQHDERYLNTDDDIGFSKVEERNSMRRGDAGFSCLDDEVSHWRPASLVKSGSVCSGGGYETCRVSYAVDQPGANEGAVVVQRCGVNGCQHRPAGGVRWMGEKGRWEQEWKEMQLKECMAEYYTSITSYIGMTVAWYVAV
jgi:hypothetical protein